MPTTIRPAVAADASRIADMLTQEGYPTRTGEATARLDRFATDDSVVYVAEAEDETIGFIALHAMQRFEQDGVAVRVLALAVDTAARERGVGHALMHAAEAFARGRGASFIEVTSGHHRPEARKLYEAVGFDASLTGYLRKRL